MKLKCPKGVTSINIAGVEYTADDDVVTINDQQHIDAAIKTGFTLDEATIPTSSTLSVAVESDSTQI